MLDLMGGDSVIMVSFRSLRLVKPKFAQRSTYQGYMQTTATDDGSKFKSHFCIPTHKHSIQTTNPLYIRSASDIL